VEWIQLSHDWARVLTPQSSSITYENSPSGKKTRFSLPEWDMLLTAS
jgi:hypothetical protein